MCTGLLNNQNLLNFLNDIVEQAQTKEPLSHLEHTIMYYYPLFEKHYNILILNGIITRKEDKKLLWLCNLQSLAIYFDTIKPQTLKHHKWQEIQELFSITRNLSDTLYQVVDKTQNNDYLYRIKPIIDSTILKS